VAELWKRVTYITENLDMKKTENKKNGGGGGDWQRKEERGRADESARGAWPSKQRKPDGTMNATKRKTPVRAVGEEVRE
jgi:hypothetical protein